MRKFLAENTSEKVAKRDARGRMKIMTFEQHVEELNSDDHRWMSIPEDVFTLDGGPAIVKVRSRSIWCRACGVLAEPVSIMDPPVRPSFYRYHIPGSKPGETVSKKPVCTLRTHPPPGLYLVKKD